MEFVSQARIFLNYYGKVDEELMIERFFTIPQEGLYSQALITIGMKNRDTHGCSITYIADSDNEEVIYSQARKKLKEIRQLVKQNDFVLFDSKFMVFEKTVIILLEFEIDKLPNKKKVVGPPIHAGKEAFNAWVDKHGIFFIEDGEFKTLVERKYPDVYDLLKEKYHSIERFI